MKRIEYPSWLKAFSDRPVFAGIVSTPAEVRKLWNDPTPEAERALAHAEKENNYIIVGWQDNSWAVFELNGYHATPWINT